MTDRHDDDIETRLRDALAAESERAPAGDPSRSASYVEAPAGDAHTGHGQPTLRRVAVGAIAVAAATALVVGIVTAREDATTFATDDTAASLGEETTTTEAAPVQAPPTGEESFGACDDFAVSALNVVDATGPAVFGPAPDQPPLPADQLAVHWPVAAGNVEVRFRHWADEDEYYSLTMYGGHGGPSMPGELDFEEGFQIFLHPDENNTTSLSPLVILTDRSVPVPDGCDRPLVSVPGGQSSVDLGDLLTRDPYAHLTRRVDAPPTEVVSCESITGVDHPARSGGPVPGAHPTPLAAITAFFTTPEFQSPHFPGSAGIPTTGWELIIAPDGTQTYGFSWDQGWANLARVIEGPDGWFVEWWASAC